MSKSRKLIFLGLGVLIIALGLYFLVIKDNSEPDQVIEQSNANVEEEVDAQSQKPLILTGEEYKKLFLDSSQPNTKVIAEPPAITGNTELDGRIVALAEARGYLLQKVPRSDLNSYDGDLMQQKLAESWTQLKKLAQENAIELEITSALRTVEEQKALFVERLAGGTSDEQINRVLAMTAPPGYSRHHSGYVIDIADKSATVFEYSEGYKWLSADNYLIPKQFGIIPSYPDGAKNQGPEPEAWEYVWVGQQLLFE